MFVNVYFCWCWIARKRNDVTTPKLPPAEHIMGEGLALFAQPEGRQIEGMVAKRLDSKYEERKNARVVENQKRRGGLRTGDSAARVQRLLAIDQSQAPPDNIPSAQITGI